ncbi:MAG: phospholipid carrier-dependent glycosyltransferase [Fimbriimonadales bacterium]
MEPSFLDIKLSRRGSWVAALVLFMLALGFRLAGIGWGLPNDLRNQSLHPDENLNYVVATQTPYLKPGFYHYGTLYFTALHIANDAGLSYGWVPSGENDNPLSGGIMTGRVISALSGAVTVSLVFATLLLITGTLGSFIGAVGMLLAPGHVVHSRFATTDVFATMLIALAAYLIVRFVSGKPEGGAQPKLPAIIGMGAVIGLAAGTKYAGLLMLLPLVFVLVGARVSWKGIAAGLGATVLGFLIATPGALLQSDLFSQHFMFEVSHSAEGHGLVFVDTPPGFMFHSLNLTEAFGLIPLVFGLAGLAWATSQKNKWAMALSLFFIVYFVVIAQAEVKFLRYVLPLLPLVALGLGYLAGKCHELGGWRRVVTGLIILMVGFTAATTSGAFSMTRLMATPDPRDQAARWFNDKTDAQTTIGLVSDPWFYTPPFYPDTNLLAFQDRLTAMEQNPRLIRYIAPDGEKRDWDVRLLDQKPDYIVFSSFEFIDHDRLSEPHFVEFMERMPLEYDFIAIFWGPEPAFATKLESMRFNRDMLRVIIRERYPKTHDMMYIRPTICVFKKKAT